MQPPNNLSHIRSIIRSLTPNNTEIERVESPAFQRVITKDFDPQLSLNTIMRQNGGIPELDVQRESTKLVENVLKINQERQNIID